MLLASQRLMSQVSKTNTGCMLCCCRGGEQALPPASPASHESDVNNPEVGHTLALQLLLVEIKPSWDAAC